MSLELPITLNDVLTGSEKTISLGRGGEKVSVKIPPGIETGKKLRVAGKGGISSSGGPRGDLYLLIKVKHHSVFERDHNDLIVDKKIPFSAAVLGTKISVPTLDGKNMNVKVPPGFQSNGKLRLKGLGLPNGPKGPRGNLFVRILIEVPRHVTSGQEKIIQELSEAGL
jgi:curved DNA-binding protein